MPRYALVIGISQYETFRNLPKAATDAEAIATLLEQRDYRVTRLPRKRVGENQWVIDPNKHLTQTTLNQELKEFLRERAIRQEVVIYFAGHGFRVVDPLTDEQVGYWATSDAKSAGQNAVPFNALNTLISKSELSSLVLLMDCCYAGSFLEQQSLLQPTQDAIGQKQNYCLIAACRDFEKAREGEQHGIFTAAVLQGLSAENAKQGEITSTDLFGFVSRELQRSGQEVIHAGKGQAIPLFRLAASTEVSINSTIDETCPYQGLKPFDKSTAKFFYGRGSTVQRLLEQLEQSSFIPVIGASGSGKSSAVRAGLLPALENRGWKILNIIHPGVEPIAKLKATLEQFFRDREQLSVFTQLYPRMEVEGLCPVIEHLAGDRTLLVVDQFEEVFTVCPKEDERRRFIEWLTQVAGDSASLTVVLTLRIDFLEACLHYRKLAQLIQDWQILMLPLDESELHQVIVNPAEQQGYRLGEGLLDLVLEDVRREKNCLPLLEFALTELWKPATKQGHQLTLAQYREMGRVAGALNRHAENLYERLTSVEQEWAKRIFLKLVRTGAEERDSRQRQLKQHLLEMSESVEARQVMERVLQVMVNGRLLVTDDSETLEKQQSGGVVVDLAHEALMEGWERFVEWRREDRGIRRLVDRIEDAYQEWLHHQKDEKFLMMGGLLTQAQIEWSNLEKYLESTAKDFYEKSNVYQEKVLEALAYISGEKAKIHGADFFETYETTLEALGMRYRQELQAKDEQIEAYRRKSANMMEIVRKMAEKPITYDFRNAKFGGGFAAEAGVQASGTFNNTSSQQDLIEAAKDIQQLLNDLSESHPITTQSEKMAVVAETMEQITKNPSMKDRIISAFKVGGIEALRTSINHPLVNLVLAALEGWSEAD